MSELNDIHVWTDGSCINNGRNDAMCGIGIYYGDNDVRNVSSRIPNDEYTNNRAELCAILYVLCTNVTEQPLVLHTDSKHSIDCIVTYSPRWKTNDWKKTSGEEIKWCGIIRYIVKIIDKRNKNSTKTEFVHVRGHSKDKCNDAADYLARNAASHGEISHKINFLSKVCSVPFS